MTKYYMRGTDAGFIYDDWTPVCEADGSPVNDIDAAMRVAKAASPLIDRIGVPDPASSRGGMLLLAVTRGLLRRRM